MNKYAQILKSEIETRMSIKPLAFNNGVDAMISFVADKLTETLKENKLKYDSWIKMAEMGMPFAVIDNNDILEFSMYDVFWGILKHFADIKMDMVSVIGTTFKLKNHIREFMTKDEVVANLALLRAQDSNYKNVVINFISDKERPRHEMALYCVINNINIFRMKANDDNEKYMYDKYTINNLLVVNGTNTYDNLKELISMAILFQRNKFMDKLITTAKQYGSDADINCIIEIIAEYADVYGINCDYLLKKASRLDI